MPCVTSWVCCYTLIVWWERSKGFFSSERNQPKSPEHPHVLPMCQKLSREKGDTSGLRVCISFYQSVTEPWRYQHYRHLRDAHLATRQARDYSASQKVAGSKMSNPFKTPEGQWRDRSPQKRILPSLQINKWTWITGCCLQQKAANPEHYTEAQAQECSWQDTLE